MHLTSYNLPATPQSVDQSTDYNESKENTRMNGEGLKAVALQISHIGSCLALKWDFAGYLIVRMCGSDTEIPGWDLEILGWETKISE